MLESLDYKINNNTHQQLSILVICGPASSGKTTLVKKIEKNFSSIKTLPRHQLLKNVRDALEQEVFSELYTRASGFFQQQVTCYRELFEQVKLLEGSPKEEATKFLDEYRMIRKSQYYQQRLLKKIYKSYYESIKQIHAQGHHVILDEGYYFNTEERMALFHQCCEDYPYIKKILLFNTLEELLKKCQSRNEKFKSLVGDVRGKVKIDKLISEILLLHGSSSLFRSPYDILRNYHVYYEFKSTVSANEQVLHTINREELAALCQDISTAQRALDEYLLSIGYYTSLTALPSHDINALMHEIIGDSDKVYVVSTMKYDTCLCAADIPNISSLDDASFLSHYLKNILPVASQSQEFAWHEHQLMPTSSMLKTVISKQVQSLSVFAWELTGIDLYYPHLHSSLNQNRYDDFYREHKLYLTSLGKVVVIHGISSSGKSTVCRVMNQNGFMHITGDDIYTKFKLDYYHTTIISSAIKAAKKNLSPDDFMNLLCGLSINTEKYPEHQELISYLYKMIPELSSNLPIMSSQHLYNELYHAARSVIFSGMNVVIDVASNNVSLLHQLFGDYPITTMLLYTSLKDSILNCLHRNHRAFLHETADLRQPTLILMQYMRFFDISESRESQSTQSQPKQPIIASVSRGELAECMQLVRTSQREFISLAMRRMIFADDDYPQKKIEHMNRVLEKFREQVLDRISRRGDITYCGDRPSHIIDFTSLSLFLNTNSTKLSPYMLIRSSCASSCEIKNSNLKSIFNQLSQFVGDEIRTRYDLSLDLSLDAESFELSKVAELLGCRFVIFYPESRPALVGNRGVIIKLSWLNERYHMISIDGTIIENLDSNKNQQISSFI